MSGSAGSYLLLICLCDFFQPDFLTHCGPRPVTGFSSSVLSGDVCYFCSGTGGNRKQ